MGHTLHLMRHAWPQLHVCILCCEGPCSSAQHAIHAVRLSLVTAAKCFSPLGSPDHHVLTLPPPCVRNWKDIHCCGHHQAQSGKATRQDCNISCTLGSAPASSALVIAWPFCTYHNGCCLKSNFVCLLSYLCLMVTYGIGWVHESSTACPKFATVHLRIGAVMLVAACLLAHLSHPHTLVHLPTCGLTN